MATPEQELSVEQKELVALGASVGAGCHPCADHHLKAGAKAGLEDERLLAVLTSAERVTAEAAARMADHVRSRLAPSGATPASLSLLDEALASLGAALGANDARNIERQLRIAAGLGASRPQLRQAIETAQKVQENAARIHLREAERLLDSIAGAPETESVAGDGCGCGEAQEAEAAPAEAAAGSATAGPAGDLPAFAVAMAECRQMFGRAWEGPAATAATGPRQEEV